MLAPNAKFSYWPDDNREVTWQDNTVDYVKLGGWCVAWKKNNEHRCPDLSELQAIQKQDIIDEIARRDKEYWINHYAKDLTMVANYELEKKTNPALTFRDYIGELKVKQADIIDDIRPL